MAQNLKELKKIVAFMKKEGVSDLKAGDIDIKLTPYALMPKNPTTGDPEEQPKEVPPTEEDMLFWSAPGYIPGPKEAN